MSIFPLAANLAAARQPDVPRVRTEDEATSMAGGPVFRQKRELPDLFETPRRPNKRCRNRMVRGSELIWRDGWRVTMRYWRPALPAPLPALAPALKKPLGHARVRRRKRVRLLGAPAELVSEVLPKLYVDRKQLMKRWADVVKNGLGEMSRNAKQVRDVTTIGVRCMRRHCSAAGADRTHRTCRARRCTHARTNPQADLDIGLFKTSDGKSNVVLVTEEGDGRFRAANENGAGGGPPAPLSFS
jgi:hypothetical protein